MGVAVTQDYVCMTHMLLYLTYILLLYLVFTHCSTSFLLLFRVSICVFVWDVSVADPVTRQANQSRQQGHSPLDRFLPSRDTRDRTSSTRLMYTGPIGRGEQNYVFMTKENVLQFCLTKPSGVSVAAWICRWRDFHHFCSKQINRSKNDINHSWFV